MQSLRYGIGDYECHMHATIFAFQCLLMVRITADVIRRHFLPVSTTVALYTGPSAQTQWPHQKETERPFLFGLHAQLIIRLIEKHKFVLFWTSEGQTVAEPEFDTSHLPQSWIRKGCHDSWMWYAIPLPIVNNCFCSAF